MAARATEPRRLPATARTSEPIVCDTPSVSRQVIKAVETVEMVDGQPRYCLRFRQPHIHGDATAPFLVRLQRAPIGDTAAIGTEMEFERLAADVGFGRTGDLDALILVVVGPQHAIAPTHGAIARRDRVRHAFVPPLHCAAVAGAFEHFSLRHTSSTLAGRAACSSGSAGPRPRPSR